MFGHHETGGNIANYEAQLDDAMKPYGGLAVDVVKTGYVADAGRIITPGDQPGQTRMEYHAWGTFANGPDHEPTLVYTRMLSGPMDFTLGVLSLESADHAPLAKQLGLYLALYSPIQMEADFIETLAKYPRKLDFISKVPADWSESHLIAGAVGDRAMFARKDRHSENWYVDGVNDATARTCRFTSTIWNRAKTIPPPSTRMPQARPI